MCIDTCTQVHADRHATQCNWREPWLLVLSFQWNVSIILTLAAGSIIHGVLMGISKWWLMLITTPATHFSWYCQDPGGGRCQANLYMWWHQSHLFQQNLLNIWDSLWSDVQNVGHFGTFYQGNAISKWTGHFVCLFVFSHHASQEIVCCPKPQRWLLTSFFFSCIP